MSNTQSVTLNDATVELIECRRKIAVGDVKDDGFWDRFQKAHQLFERACELEYGSDLK